MRRQAIVGLMNKSEKSYFFDAVYVSPVGGLGLQLLDGKLVGIRFCKQKPKLASDANSTKIEGLSTVTKALDQYFKKGKKVDFPQMEASGTPFQQRVWDQLNKIPFGQTRTYGEIAKVLDSHPRAVGGACRANPLVVLVPCHRVVAANGLGGFSGEAEGHWPSVKTWLLKHEEKLA